MAKLFNNKIFFLKQNASEVKEKSEYSVTCKWMWFTYVHTLNWPSTEMSFHQMCLSVVAEISDP